MDSKRIALAFSAVLVLSAAAMGQTTDNSAPPPPQQQQGPAGQSPRRMDPARQLKMLTRRLNLSDDQRAQIKPLLEERRQKMQALFQDQSLSRDQVRAQMRTIHEETRGKIEAVLNDQQKQQYEAMDQARMNRRNNPPPPPPNAAPQQ